MAAAALATASAARAQTFVVRGRVTAADGAPLADATIVISELGAPPSTPTSVGQSNARGDCAVTVTRLAGTYLVAVAKDGYVAQRRPLARGASESFAAGVDFQLSPTPVLGAVRTVAKRTGPARDERNARPRPGADEATLGLGDALGGDLTGDLAAALALVPGVTITPDATGVPRPAAFALGADQTGVTLNGSDVAGTLTAPRDGLLATVRLSTYDPRNGRAAGPIVSLTLPSGSYVVTRTVRGTLDDPAVQTAPRAVPSGAQYARQIASGTTSGPLGSSGRQFYNAAAQLDRRASELTTLATAGAPLLGALGVGADSVARALAVASRIGVPITAPDAPRSQRSTSGSAMARVDFTPGFAQSFLGGGVPREGNVAYLLASGSWTESGAAGALPFATGSRLLASRQRSGQLLANYETYYGQTLHVLRSSVSRATGRVAPYVDAPGVLVATGGSSDVVGAGALALGGPGGGASRTGSTRWQTTSDLSRATPNGRHLFDVYADVLYDRATSTTEPGAGTFVYPSLNDLAAGRPSAFERALGTRGVTGNAWRGALALSDVHQPEHLPWPLRNAYTKGLALQYGLRVDGARFTGVPNADPNVLSRFGRRTNDVPNEIAVQPMAGFTWQRGMMWFLSGGARYGEPRHVFSGGVRRYAGVVTPLAVGSVTGSGAETRLRCVGDAVPTPNWSAYAASLDAVPTQCVGAPGSASLTESAPSRTLYAPGFTAARSWRGELRWQWRASGTFGTTLGVAQAVNRSLLSSVDLNLVPAARFTLANEGGRGVFADPGAFVQQTGAVAVTASRLVPEFARVREYRSDGRSSQSLLTAGVTRWLGTTRTTGPMTPPPAFSGTLDLTYTLAATRERTRGFDATTAGDPRAFTWSAAAAPRHAVQLRLSGQREGWFTLSATAQLASGVAYTPVVRGDVNGDGVARNDRAFVVDPASAADTAFGAAMRRLLGASPDRVRSCLQRQRGQIAAQGSCRGAWSATLGTVALTLDPHRVGLGGRGTVSLYVTNALGAVDQLLHGASGARGWGAPSIPDATLLTVRGFEPSTRRFVYAVNPRFGRDLAPALALGRPATLTLDVRLDVSPNRVTQELTHYFREKPAGLGVERDSAKLSAYLTGMGRSNLSGLSQITKQARKFDLSRGQLDSLRALDARLAAYRDSVHGELAHYLVAPSTDLRSEAARERWRLASVAILTKMYETGRPARPLLTDEQYEAVQSDTWPVAMLDYTPLWLARALRGPFIYPW